MAWYKKLHWKIIIGLILGVIYGVVAASMGWTKFTFTWIVPWGTIFINALKAIAIPLVLTSLITGVASLSDIKRLSRIGGKTIGVYIFTTLIAVSIGLVFGNVFQPGKGIPTDLQEKLKSSYSKEISNKKSTAENVKDRSPLQPLVDMVPNNVFASLTGNGNMLQVVFIAILLGICLIQIPSERSTIVVDMVLAFNEAVIRGVDIIMLMAPIGVFALITKTIVSVAGDDISKIVELLSALGFYCLIVVGGLFTHAFIVYPTILKFFTPMKIKTFFQGIAPAQLLAFSTSSSGATLPLTMERCEENLGVSDEVSSFVLPLGATINMDGTALYQAIAALFIAQATGMDLSFGAQMTIVFTTVLASIGTAAVPGAGIIMLVVILESIGVPSAGIALILGVDRILDMIRTVVNVTGDATVTVLIASTENQLGHVDLTEDHNKLKTTRRDN